MMIKSRFGRQPYMDRLKSRRISTERAAHAIGVDWFHLRNAGYGYISPRQELRKGLAEFFKEPMEELFTPESLASVPLPVRTPRRKRKPRANRPPTDSSEPVTPTPPMV